MGFSSAEVWEWWQWEKRGGKSVHVCVCGGQNVCSGDGEDYGWVASGGGGWVKKPELDQEEGSAGILEAVGVQTAWGRGNRRDEGLF